MKTLNDFRENKSMVTLKKQTWSAMMKTLVDEKIQRGENLVVNGYIVFLEDMIKIRNNQRTSINGADSSAS